MLIQCPLCNGTMDGASDGRIVSCPFCRRAFQMPTREPELTIDVHRRCGTFRRHYSEVHPGLAAVLSFLFVGLGQIYSGAIGKGLLFWCIGVVCGMIFWAHFPDPMAGVPLLMAWVGNIIDAYCSADSRNQREFRRRA